MFRIISTFLISMIVATPSFASWTGDGYIETLKIQANGVVIASLEGFSSNSQGCVDDRFKMSSSGGSYDERLSMLMSAYMSGKPIRFSYYGCDGDYVALSSVEFR